MVCVKECGIGWEVRGIYEGESRDLLESEEFMLAFGKVRNIDGHEVQSILTPVKRSVVTGSYEHEGVNEARSVLVVSSKDMTGMRVNDTLRIDGELYVIEGVSRPSGDIVRMELVCGEL